MALNLHDLDGLKEECPRQTHDWDWWSYFLQRNYFGGAGESRHWKQAARCIYADLGLQPGMRLLDLGSGSGDIEFELGLRGLDIIGLEQSRMLVEDCRRIGVKRGIPVEFVHGDMFTYEPEGLFDAVLCINTSFGYGSDAQNRALISRVARMLRPDGAFYLDLIVADEAEAFGTWSDYLLDGILIVENTWDENEQIMTSWPYYLSPEENLLYDCTSPEQVRIYSLEQLGDMFASAGLTLTRLKRGPGHLVRQAGPNRMETLVGRLTTA